jgi:uncharacterized membrane-anchored protein YjiN (DUF445 family)
MADPALQSIVTDVEKELLEQIIANLKADLLTEEQAQQLAKDFLALLPMEDKRDLLDKLFKFSQKHTEAKGVYLKYAKPYEEEDRLKKIELMSQHIKDGNIEHAINVAKGVPANA